MPEKFIKSQSYQVSRIVKNRITVVAILCIGLHKISGQVSIDSIKPDEKRWQLFKYDMKHVFGGLGHSYAKPLHWKGKDWATLGYTALGTGILFLVDDETSKFARIQREGIPKSVREYGSKIGNPTYNYALTGGIYMTGLVTKNEKIRQTGVLMIASASAAGLLQQIAKSAVGRARPVSGKSKDTFDPFSTSRSFHSFPSGHAILAFTNAYAIGKQFNNPWLKGGIYAVGLIPGVSRIWDGQHWLSDVALGIAISVFTVESIDKYLKHKYSNAASKDKKLVSWNLNLGLNRVGITGNF
tara:strand:- start:10717 stop:11610 length:894 start_codon:yes stop_codon:yes gene_type:complete